MKVFLLSLDKSIDSREVKMPSHFSPISVRMNLILSRDKRQGNRAKEREKKKQVSSFLARITRIRETLSLFCRLKTRFRKETCSNREKFERESDKRRGSIERFDAVYWNKFQSRTCVPRTRANWSGSGAVPTRRTSVNLYREWK